MKHGYRGKRRTMRGGGRVWEGPTGGKRRTMRGGWVKKSIMPTGGKRRTMRGGRAKFPQ